MHTYDISLTLSPECPVWPGDPRIELDRVERMEDGSLYNLTHLRLSAHVGTHVDAPFHFVGVDATTVEKLPLNVLTGRAYVLHLPDEVELITAAVLEKANIPPRTRRLLFRTRNSNLWGDSRSGAFFEDFVAVSEDGAKYLVDHGVRLVGIDYLSIAPFNEAAPTHKVLLQAGIIVVEGLDLSQVSQGRYTLYCLPLKLKGCDGAPARAILIGV